MQPDLSSMSIQTSPFLERLIRFLIPFFTGVTADSEAARAEILETLVSYGARTRAELLNAVQAIALGMASLDMIHQAKTTEMSPSMRLRFVGCANNLTRNSQKHEEMLNKSLACDKPDKTEPTAETVNDVSDAEAEMTLEEVGAKIASMRHRLFGAAAGKAGNQPDQLPWGSPMMAALADEIAASNRTPT